MHKYKVADNRLLSKTTRLLTLNCNPDSDPLLFRPGQYAAIGYKNKKRPTAMRCFSITSSPSHQSTLQFSMRIKGRFTRALQNLNAGDEVTVRGPFGGFVLMPQQHKNVVLFAGGIGIAPFMSMLRYVTELKLDTKIHLVYSAATSDDIPFLDDLKSIAKTNPNVQISFVIGDGKFDHLDRFQTLPGRIDDKSISQLKLNIKEQTFFVCGPPPYMKALIKLLSKVGAPRENILSEAFSQGSSHQTGKLKSWPFSMYAIGAVSLIASGFFIVMTDFYKTLPNLQKQSKPTSTATNGTLKKKSGGLGDSVGSVKPQVNTDTSQAPIVKNNTPTPAYSSGGSTSSASSGSTITPTPTTKPKAPPATTVS